MRRRHRSLWAAVSMLAAMAVLAAAGSATAQKEKAAEEPAGGKAATVPEIETLLGNLTIDPPRTHKTMIVFPIRWGGKQAPGEWETLDEAAAAGHLKVTEKDQASVPEVQMENTGDKTVLILSGEIIKGGRQTRTVRSDTILEPKQKVTVPVFCVEAHRWHGRKEFTSSPNVAPSSIQGLMKRGADQGAIWSRAGEAARRIGAPASPTESLDEHLESENVQKKFEEVHKDLGKFSPPDTIGIAVADARTGRVVGMELFGRRDLFEKLQDKLVEGYATDLVLAADEAGKTEEKKVTAADVEAFIRQAAEGTNRYEDTPGSGRGLDLVSGTLRGKGVALGGDVIHLSIQDLRPEPAPVRPIVNPPQEESAR